jgi:hypothetical protein
MAGKRYEKVCKDQVSRITGHQAIYCCTVCCITHQQLVIPQIPKVREQRDGNFRRLGNRVLIGQSFAGTFGC